jgi:hypothetical protein
MSIVGLDWNATRAVAVVGAARDYPLPVPLEPPAAELAMVLDLTGREPVVGGAARRRCRLTPHQVCHGFLPLLGTAAQASPGWKIGRRTLDAAGAADYVWQRLHGLCRSASGIVLALPAYLHMAQADLLRALAAKHKLPVQGSVPAVLAAALAGHTQQLWSRAALVVDVDDHALTVALILASQESAHLLETRCVPALGLRAWHDRLINALADLCVWQTRRDPRDAPQAEQGLYDQLDSLIDACQRRHPIQLAVQASQWYHHVLVQPGQTLAFCSPLASQAARAVEGLGNIPPADEAPPTILMTHQAARLPGLRGMLTALAQAWAESADGLPAPPPRAATDDFGEDLLFDAAPEPLESAAVAVLAPEAAARAAHALAEPLRLAQAGPGHITSLAPLPLAEPMESGPARLHFAGRDYLVQSTTFSIGTGTECHLRLDPHEYPEVAERHCEIAYDRMSFVLFNRSRQGTLVNDASVSGSVPLRAGDRIRLGAHGPQLRFLGNVPAKTSLYHTPA